MKRNLAYVRKMCANRSYYEQEAFIRNVTELFIPEKKEEMIQKIETEVLEWLHDENGEEVYQFSYHTPDKKNWETLLFTRSDIFIKSCGNGWEVWRIATASNYPKMISYKVCNIGLNDNYPGNEISLPNEIKGDNYDPSFPEPVITPLATVDLFATGQIVGG